MSDKLVCVECIGDPILRSEIARRESVDVCNYCGKHGPTTTIEKLTEEFKSAFNESYAPVNNFMREEHGWPLHGKSLEEIAAIELKTASNQLAEDVATEIANLFNSEISDTDFSGPPPSDTLYEKVRPSDWYLSFQWERMVESLRTKARFVNPQAVEVLSQIFDGIKDDRTDLGEPVVVEVARGHDLAALYRAREFAGPDEVRRALTNPERELGPPPAALAGSGRMNARGVSIFYGANSQTVATAEIRPAVGSWVVIAKFQVRSSLRLLDLTRLQRVRVAEGSIFDEAARKAGQRHTFISKLERNLTMPVFPGGADEGYLITQVIADYLATHRTLKLDGLIFKSVQVKSHPGKPALNVALFHGSSRLYPFYKEGSKLSCNLYVDYGAEEDSLEYRPTITVENALDDKLEFLDFIDEDSPLQLVPTEIVISQVKGIEFVTEDKLVRIETASSCEPPAYPGV